MAVWSVGDNELDFQLVQNGFVSAFHGSDVLGRALEWLRGRGYRTVVLDAQAWTSAADMHDAFARALSFPEHYGRNLDAFADCLMDVAEIEYGWSSADTGLVLVLDGFHGFYRREHAALPVLQILDEAGQRAALFGNRILTLLRTDEPDDYFGPIGGHEVAWNPNEFLQSERKR